MKRISALIVTIVAVFALVGHAKAAPMYYTFDGTVSSIGFDDSSGIIADAGLAVGSAVTYTLIVDLAADGTYTRNDTTVITLTDTAATDWFFTDYVSGNALRQRDGGWNNDPEDTAEYNYGYNHSSTTTGLLWANSLDDRLQIHTNDSIVSGWAVGDAVTGYNIAFDSSGDVSALYADLTLTSISDTAPVPEPSTLLLLGSGLAGLGFVRRKCKN